MKKTLKTGRGFTLLELMMVVVIISVLASVAIPAMNSYMRRAKTSEVFGNLRKMYDGEMAYYNDEHVDSAGNTLTKQFIATDVQPAWPPGRQKKLGFFSDQNWDAISFSVDSPLQYCYMADAYPFPSDYPWRPADFDPTEDPPSDLVLAFQVAAAGDLDEDGRLARFERAAWIKIGEKELVGEAAVFVEWELE